MSVNPSQVDLISRLINATTVRQRVISQNVANVNTPGYRRQEVNFEDRLRDALKHHDVEGAMEVEPEMRQTAGLAERSDGNNVDIDMEMGQLTKNSILFETYSQILATKLGMLRSAISGDA